MCTLPKLLWLIKNEPEAWEQTQVFIYPKDYIAYRLTGALATDPSDASGSSLFDPAAGHWSNELLERFSIPASKLPRVRASTDVSGHVTEEAARETGFSPGTPVIVGGSDAVTEMFSSGVVDRTGAKLRLGTSGAISTITSKLSDIPEDSLVYLWAFVEEGTWMLDINTRSCAQSTAWLMNILFGDGRDSTGAFIEMAKMAETVPVGSDGLFFHPYLMGEDAPYWDHRLTASFFGLNVSHTRSHLVRAVYEGTAFALADAKGALGTIADTFSAYHLIGGGTKNKIWTGIVLDVLGVDGILVPDASAAKGAALLAGVGAGVFSNPRDAARRCVTGREEISHNKENHTRYINLFERYKTLKQMFDRTYEPTSS
jgi:xylulokinase